MLCTDAQTITHYDLLINLLPRYKRTTNILCIIDSGRPVRSARRCNSRQSVVYSLWGGDTCHAGSKFVLKGEAINRKQLCESNSLGDFLTS